MPDRSGNRPSPSSSNTHVAAGSIVTGKIEGKTDVVIDGQLDGQVQIEGRIRVGTDGRVEGSLESAVVEVGGRVDGDVRGRERIILTASARLHGNLEAPRVVIEEGAFFKGQVNMSGRRGRAPAQSAASSRPGTAQARTDGGSK